MRGCPPTPDLLIALEVVGFVAIVFLAGVLMVSAWELYQDRLRRRLEE